MRSGLECNGAMHFLKRYASAIWYLVLGALGYFGVGQTGSGEAVVVGEGLSGVAVIVGAGLSCAGASRVNGK